MARALLLFKARAFELRGARARMYLPTRVAMQQALAVTHLPARGAWLLLLHHMC
jgi:hypothetical protein